MRPALQRLLARPQAFDLLRYLVCPPTREAVNHASVPRHRRRFYDNEPRWFSSAAAQVTGPEGGRVDQPLLVATHQYQSTSAKNVHTRTSFKNDEQATDAPLENVIVTSDSVWGPIRHAFSAKKRGFQPDTLTAQSRSRQDAMVEFQPAANRLKHRMKEYGYHGVLALWQAVQSRHLALPTEGRLATGIWCSLLDMGFDNDEFLEQLCDHANETFAKNGKRWGQLYSYVMRGVTSRGSPEEIVCWHIRLTNGGHFLGPKAFESFMRTMVHSRHDTNLVRTLYGLNRHRNAYRAIMKTLIDSKDFELAIEWHIFLIQNGDTPSHNAAQFVEILADYLIRSTRRMQQAVKNSAAVIRAHKPEPLRTVRELMNLAQGDAFNIKPKEYNDSLGARWFATRWFSLDFAINTISSLGVQSIGPISLQAIGLREPDSSSVLRRIEQLNGLGISIGTSVFCKALHAFAKNGDQDSLIGLLESDQHPDALEDLVLQNRLLASYAASGDWAQYRRTLAVQLAISEDPEALKHNLALRRHATNARWSNLLHDMNNMHRSDIPVERVTAEYVIKCLLGRRPKQRKMSPTIQNLANLDTAIRIMIDILKYNGRFSIYNWREIFCRLGMLGKLNELERVARWLASWYGHYGSRSLPPKVPENSEVCAGRRWPKSNPKVNLAILFNPSFQQIIIKWGFIHRQPRNSISILSPNARDKEVQLGQYVRGVQIVKGLRHYGVDVKISTVKKALLNRFVLLYGSGTSTLPRNRSFRAMNLVTLEELVDRASLEWGEKLWTEISTVRQSVAMLANKSMARRARRTRLPYIYVHGRKVEGRDRESNQARRELGEEPSGKTTFKKSFMENGMRKNL